MRMLLAMAFGWLIMGSSLTLARVSELLEPVPPVPMDHFIRSESPLAKNG